MLVRVIILLFFLLLNGSLTWAQTQFQLDRTNTLLGHWEGGFIKGNSLQALKIRFYLVDNQPVCWQTLEEWLPNHGELEFPVRVDSSGMIHLPSPYGPVDLQLDESRLELIGQVRGTAPAVYVHLKKKPMPPEPAFTVEPVTILNEKIKLAGHLHKPTFPNSATAVILVGGRGCYASETSQNGYAQFLRSYGLTVLAYQKRGTGDSTGDCEQATIDELASDLRAAYQFLKNHPRQFQKIGVLGISAGAWVAQKAQESGTFDFTMTIVGPATSVETQQLQSSKYGARKFELSQKAETDLMAYMELVLQGESDRKTLKAMEQLLSTAEIDGWEAMLESTDIPQKVKDLDQLWARRHRFDPKAVLGLYNKPYLAIFGAEDWVVPPAENIKTLEGAFSGDRRFLLHTYVLPESGHGMDTEADYRVLESGASYWHYYRAAPQLTIHLVEFLEAFGLLE